jgi:hypothetical protein
MLKPELNGPGRVSHFSSVFEATKLRFIAAQNAKKAKMKRNSLYGVTADDPETGIVISLMTCLE